MIQACEALAEAHSLGIVHRDIKPTNLFLTSRPDGSLLLKVLDFGISKSPSGAELSLTQTWSLLGSPAYMSPEQMRSARHVDGRTDIWSLGAVLYEAVEGHLPFQAESFSEMCVMVSVDAPTAMTAAPPALAAIIERCLAKDAAQRYASVAELGKDLARLAREPDKAQILVDRMHRMLGRGIVRRTPPMGLPQTGHGALYGKPTPQREVTPAPAMLPTPPPGSMAMPAPMPGSMPTPPPGSVPLRPSGVLPTPPPWQHGASDATAGQRAVASVRLPAGAAEHSAHVAAEHSAHVIAVRCAALSPAGHAHGADQHGAAGGASAAQLDARRGHRRGRARRGNRRGGGHAEQRPAPAARRRAGGGADEPDRADRAGTGRAGAIDARLGQGPDSRPRGRLAAQ